MKVESITKRFTRKITAEYQSFEFSAEETVSLDEGEKYQDVATRVAENVRSQVALDIEAARQEEPVFRYVFAAAKRELRESAQRLRKLREEADEDS